MNRSKRKSHTNRKQPATRNWDIKDGKGRTCVVIQAATADLAAQRVRTIWAEIPRIPRGFSVALHRGPVHSSWYGDGWFATREEVDRRGLDAESRFWQEVNGNTAE